MTSSKRTISPFILCGGMGTRLWPLSREAVPKQFHTIAGPETLFQQTCHRLTGHPFGSISVLSNSRHRFLVADQLAQIGIDAEHIVLEPIGRNTGPAACIAALIAGRADPGSLVLLAPSDHVIGDAKSFANSVASGIEPAREGALVTFGVQPDRPHTGYGYIEIGEANDTALPVKRFVEKPSCETAEAYLEAGNFYWNAGLYLFRAATMIDLMQSLAPEILQACRKALETSIQDLDFLRLGAAYADAPAISLDYAIAEKAQDIRCIPLSTSWSDVGSWSEIWHLGGKNENGNVRKGSGEAVFAEARDSYVYSDNGCVALIGLDNVVVVSTEDAVLVASKEHTESLKGVVKALRAAGNAHTIDHSQVYRPWGWYKTVNRGSRHQVKCLMVKPGGKLSLQSHHHRSEHWVVVQGTLEVTKGDDVELLSENQSTYIAIGERHRLANLGKIPAFLIEVQSGTYLDEDDIVRYDDVYGRDTKD